MLTLSVPVSVAAAVMREGMKRSNDLATRANATFASWWGSINSQDKGQRRGMPPSPMNPRGVKTPPPPSREDREDRAASIQVNPSDNVVLQSRQPMLFSAIPVDSQGGTIQGLQAQWESSNRQIVFVNKNGQAVAGKPGTAILTAKAGSARESVRVTVIEGTREKFGGKKKENSRRPQRQAGRNTSGVALANVARKSAYQQQHAYATSRPTRAGMIKTRGFEPLLPLRDPNEDPLPDDETHSLYSAANSVGSPPGKKTLGATTAAAATDGTESPGSENFTFTVPVVTLPGRGMDVTLDLNYNSRTYNKSVDSWDGSTWLTYDVDSGWPAAGFRLGYGQIEDQGAFGFTLTDADGTRHALDYTSPYNYDTDDGTFIHFTGGRGWGSLFYSDGSRVDYGAAGGGFRSYPTRIVDPNGNFVLINYVNGIGPKISSIQDTLGRFVRFYYAANGDLVTITAPGLTGQPDRQVIRFYYQDISLNSSGLFQSTVNLSAPPTTRVIKYIYFPNNTESSNAHLGYRYDYSAYGMMYQIVQLRGMTVDSGALDQTGWISNEGLLAALTTYNYPITPSDLADVPAYTRRTDDWAGRTTGMPGTGEAPYYTFAVDQTNGISTVTAPDGTVTETHSIVALGQWNDGLVNKTIVKQTASGPTLARTEVTWELDGSGRNARAQQVQLTNDTQLTTTTVYTYTTYNNVTVASIRGFDGAEVRRVENEYLTDPAWINRRLLHLPTTTRVYAGGATTPTTRADFGYDTAGVNLVPRDDIIMHEDAFDPFAPTEESCNWECINYDEWGNCYWEWVCNYYNPYNPATDKRGNVTSVTNYADAANGGGAITNTFTYDIAGNVVTAQVACCQQKSITYSNSYYYAYPTSVTSGAGPTLTTNVNYDFNTGLVANTTDENGQTTYSFYHGDSLRPEHVDHPDGSAVTYHYNDNLSADAAGRNHYYVSTTTKLDSSRNLDSYLFFDGRGAVTQSFNNWTQANGWSTKDTEYDAMGRAYRFSHPYYSAGYGAVAINPSSLWTTQTFDSLGRVTRVDAPSGDVQNPTATYTTAEYSGIITTVTDQAGKKRRQKTDALGHVIRMDEPDLNGDLGSTEAPNQYTTYEYDARDQLIHIAQGSQHRYFKYDSLGLLTHQRDVEQDAPYTTPDSVAGNNQWSRKVVYNSQGLVEDAYDARQIKTHFVYDGLNRITQINYFLANGSPDPATPSAFYYYDSQTLPAGAPSFDRGYSTSRVVAMTYGSSTSTTGNYFGYDKMGRVVTQRQVTGVNTFTLSYSYNLGGLVTRETYPSGRTLSYAFDEGGRLSQVSDGTTVFAGGFSFEPHGGLSTETFGNGAVHSMAYNRALQPSEIKLKQSASGAELQRFNYSYGVVNQSDGSVDTTKNNGQIGRIDSYINGAKQWDQRFSYDSLSRLSIAGEYRGDNGQQTWRTQYTYDRWGNRFQSGSGNSGVGYVPVVNTDIVETTNRFISNGLTPITYDAAGNITSDTKFRGMNYSYDANGRQTFAERTDHTSSQTSIYDCAGRRVRTSANGVTRTMVYDIFGQDVADYTGSSGSSLERENIYRGGQLLSVLEASASSAAPPAGLSAVPSGSASIALNWSTASGATNYRVERKGAGGSYTLVGTTASTNLTDTGVSNGSAYLYRVCAANSQGNCVSTFSNVALGASVSFTDSTITTFAENPSNATTAKAAHITELRSAVNAVRSLAGLAGATWTNPTLTSGVTTINAADVRDLREKLDEALVVLSIQTSAYTDSTLAGAPNGTLIKRVHITELRQRATSGSGSEGSGGDACYKTLSQFVKDFFQGTLKRQPNSDELSQWTNTLTQAQLQGQAQLMGAAQSLGTALFTSPEYLNLNTSNAQYITDLYAGYLQRLPDTPGYNFWLGILNGGETRANIRQGFALSTEFQNNVNALCTPLGTNSSVKYVLADAQGSARAIMNNGSYGSSTVISRHDYLPFGEEIWAGTGLRSTTQGYNAADKVRQKYALLERDDVTGLDHTTWRKYESFSGRWTSPDPYGGSMSIANPQSFNRYSYTQNDPINSIDPTGLMTCFGYHVYILHFENGRLIGVDYLGFLPVYCWDDGPIGGGGPGGGGPGGGPSGRVPLTKKDQKTYDQQREKARKRGITQNCAQFLTSHGINPNDVMTAIDLQQPWSGTQSTISRIDAGVRDFESEGWRNYQNMNPRGARDFANGPVKLDFKRGRSGAETGIAPGGVTGATIAERSNVYFTGGGINSGIIFHEALHSATGLGDERLAAKLDLKGSDPSQAIQKALKDHGCI
jgi:RHS repeat-associated protein